MDDTYPPEGILLTFEGLDGTGKTTQINYFEEYLKKNNIPYLICREPGGTELGEEIRKILFKNHQEETNAWSEILLFLAARAQLWHEKIAPALQQKFVVICDRFIDSSLAYQGYARGLNREKISELNMLVTQSYVPHRTYLLDLNPEITFERLEERGETNNFDALSFAFRERVREAYLYLASQNPKRIKTINAAQSILQIQNEIIADFEELLANSKKEDIIENNIDITDSLLEEYAEITAKDIMEG